MSQVTSATPLPSASLPPLGLRARALMQLERWFPPMPAPHTGSEQASYEFKKAAGSYSAAVAELGGLTGKTVLDFGCGWGGETVWLAQQADQAFGCDINPEALEAAEAFKAHTGQSNVTFALAGETTLPFADDQFDAIFSTNVFEHVMQPVEVLREIRRVLKPGGAMLTRFGPLFYSPLGYHVPWATQVPWAHLLFGFGPIMQVRNTRRSPISPASWRETGLNEITFSQFRAAVRASGLEPVRLERIAVRRLDTLAKLPGVGNLFTFGIDCHLRKPKDAS